MSESRQEEAGALPDPERRRLLRSAFVSSPLEVVAEAVAVASESSRRLYVERDRDGWRWSLTTRGGPYPLLRVTARFLLCDYFRIMVGCRTLENGVCVLTDDPGGTREGAVWAVLELEGPLSPGDAAQRILDALR